MKGNLIFGVILGLLADTPAVSAVRDGTGASIRPSTTQSRTATTVVRSNTDGTPRTGHILTPSTTRGTISRAATRTALPASTRGTSSRDTGNHRDITVRPHGASRTGITRAAAPTTIISMSDTRTGAAYNQCKTAYFQCMDQFCVLKNDDYRRCSCSNRVTELMSVRKNLGDTSVQLSEFTENLDVVGMTAAQATAINTATDGERAITADMSASKAILTAIMNSIRGEDTTVQGKFSDLNSINLSLGATNIFGLNETGQAIASYNGSDLYNAVYSSCRTAVQSDCNDASLQRAITAYLMAIEQDCNTVQTALEKTGRELKAAIREGSAMLDLARVENRKKHNSDNMATCVANVETAILSEQVCGAGYHRCLDNGEFIDITTGAPIAGVVNFYELGNLLKFDPNKTNADQKLAQNPNNRAFVTNFENRTKKFATDALDRCVEIADTVWSEYLDKALLDIYYAQQSKVNTIKTGCLDLVSACYGEKDAAITAAMSTLIDGTSTTSLMPDKITLTKQMCDNYIQSCDNMFGDTGIINEYIAAQTKTDTIAACRAIVQQCFDGFGGTNYVNFYYPASGLFTRGWVDDSINELGDNTQTTPLDWFTLYDYDKNGNRLDGYKSECAKQLANVTSCRPYIEEVFGGLDRVIAKRGGYDTEGRYKYTAPDINNDGDNYYVYGWAQSDARDSIDWATQNRFKNRHLRPTGVATEIYNQIIDSLQTQCMNVQGRFVEAQFVNRSLYYDDLCLLNFEDFYNLANITDGSTYYGYTDLPNIDFAVEYMCPKDYTLNVDITAWGMCSCWENGGRRSRNGKVSKCEAVIPTEGNGRQCDGDVVNAWNNTEIPPVMGDWGKSNINPASNQVCPCKYQNTENANDANSCQEKIPSNLPKGIQNM